MADDKTAKVNRPRRSNRTKREIAQEKLDAEAARRQKAVEKQKRLREEANALDARISQHDARIEYLAANPDLQGGENPAAG